ncbi:DUF6950 family protein [Kaistia nematophila]|uniref:DUF6950 domain-containing protein n=1 Tax=Kaistia nematophila TaxID=2994654 RepID=A0A9X3E3T9_9HYPH|nr:hypothetical protein [Kaistia nematophila]MCX5570623.1 hypothetical protein [Kaistia nematophila]
MSAIQRRDDWRPALHEAIEATRREPFQWGERDCALFAADCVKAMTGIDLGFGFRGSYDDAAGAAKALRRAGFSDLPDVVASFFEEIHPVRAGVGDIAAIETAEGWALGVYGGPRVTVLRPDGLGSVDRSMVTRAFRVP